MAKVPPPRPVAPVFHKERRELWFKGKLIKKFRQLAPNQELILLAFQEQGWPERIDDPLPTRTGRNRKRRLHETTANLKHNQRFHLLHFFVDGTGKGICWRPVE